MQSVASQRMLSNTCSAELQCVQVSELQGVVQDLEEALDRESTAHKDSQSTLEEAYRHRNRLETRYAVLCPSNRLVCPSKLWLMHPMLGCVQSILQGSSTLLQALLRVWLKIHGAVVYALHSEQLVFVVLKSKPQIPL